MSTLFLFSPARNAGKKILENIQYFQDLHVLLTRRGWGFELLILDDESKDGSQEILRDLAGRNDFLEIVLNEHNLGNGPNVEAGYRWGLSLAEDGDLIGCLDADGEHDPLAFPRLIAKIEGGKCDGIIGTIVYPDHAVGYLDRHMMRYLAFSQSQMMGLKENITYIQSSGLNLHKPELLQKVFADLLPKYREFYKEKHGADFPSWGFHAVVQTLLARAGAKLDVAYLACLGKSPNRTADKADQQAEAALRHNNTLRKFLEGLN